MKIASTTCLTLIALFCSCGYPDRYKPLLYLPEPEIRGMEIFLPAATILEQETLQARAYVILDSGRKEKAESVAWETMNADIFSVDQGGIVTGLRPGTGSIRARLDGFEAMEPVEVLRRIDYSRIVIGEVFYDSEGSDDGREFIELYNDNDYPCEITGMMVTDGAAASRNFVFPAGSVIGPKSCAVIAQSIEGFTALFGKNPDYGNFSFSLNNSGETVMFMKPDGSVLDAVFIKGGTEDFRPPESWGSATLPAAPAGQSVCRLNYNNSSASTDWSNGPPTPGY